MRKSRKSSTGGADKLSKLTILVAQLESIVVAADHQRPEPLICFDLIVDLLSTIKQEPKTSIVPCQRQCEDAIQALLVLGVGPPVRRMCAAAMVNLIEKGDIISVYARTSSLQGWLSDKMDRKSDSSSCIGVAQCLGALLLAFGQKVASGLIETNSIVAKMMRNSEESVRVAALSLLQDALDGSGGGGAVSAYSESLKIVTKLGVHDKSPIVRAAAAGCLRMFAMIGGPGIGTAGLENCCGLCLKELEDPAQAVRDGFAAALGALLALGLNPRLQQQQQSPAGKGQSSSSEPKPTDGGLHKHLLNPFVRASGPQFKEIRVSLMMALVAFLQGVRSNYLRSDLELQEFAMQAIGMLATSPDTHAQACLLFCLRVGFIEQMDESKQKQFTDHLIKQVWSRDIKPAMLVVILRTLSYLLITLGEIPVASRDALDNSFVSLLSNTSKVVRVEAALVLRTLAEVDTTSASNLMSCGVTTLRALRETVAVERGDRLKVELDALHGQAALLAALLTAGPKLVLGVPSRLPAAVWDVAKAMVLQKTGNPISVGAENEAGWMIVAAIVSSMPKEEVEEQKLDILVLWVSEFGGNVKEHLKKAQSFLSVHLRVWSAAIEALTAFVKNFVIPSMSTLNEGILLQPLLSYLSRALVYLASNALQQAPAELRPAIDLFGIKILRAYQTIPDSFSYQQDHALLLSICMSPFMDPACYGTSSCLRQLLASRDASLGPWMPGRDSLEDELRAFEGGADDLSPYIWDYEVSAFPQPLAVATMLLDEMLLCFGTVFAAQTEKKKLQLIEMVLEAGRAGKKQAWHSGNITNTCVLILRALKASIGLRLQGSPVETMNQLQIILQGILSEDVVSPAERRAAAEGLGILARLGGDSYAAQLTRALLTDARGPVDFSIKGSIAFALGCVHQSVGGMSLSTLVPPTVQTLCALAKDLSEGFPVWPLHGLWLTADAAGLSYVPHVQATLSLVMELLLSGDHVVPSLGQSIGRLINAVVAVLGPELSPGSSLFTRCKAIVAMIGAAGEPAALLECVLFTQQLVLFAPRAVPVHSHVKTLRPTLASRQPSLRQAAVSTLHHLSERDAMAMCEERIEQDLFAMLDMETDEGIIRTVRSTLQRLFEEACPSLPSRWLHLCRNVVLSASTTKGAATAGFKSSTDEAHGDTAAEVEMFGDVDQGMIREGTTDAAGSASSRRGENSLKTKDGNQLPRFKTRVFAAECLCRLPSVVGVDPTHFDLRRAKSLGGHGDWLVLHLGELVAVAYQMATGTMELVRPMGIELLDVILEKFGKTEDPMYDGHLLLEQYQAQLVSAARTALDPSASPQLVAAGSKLVARIITSGNAEGDQPLLQRMVGLLTRHLIKWDDIVNPNYAEWVGCKVQVTLLGVFACLKAYAVSGDPKQGGTASLSDGTVINSLLSKHADVLGRYWIGLLRDFTTLRLHAKSKLEAAYQPFLDGIQIVTTAHMVEQYLGEVWLIVLEAVAVNVRPELEGPSEGEQSDENLNSSVSIRISTDEFRQLWALSVMMLSAWNDDSKERVPTVTGIPSHSSRLSTAKSPEVVCSLGTLNALQWLSREGFYSPSMLSLKLCRELMQLISTPRLNEDFRYATAVLNLVDQVVKSAPQMYLEQKDVSLKVVELCLQHVFQILSRTGSVAPAAAKVDSTSDEGLPIALRTLGILAGHLYGEAQGLLLPHLLSAGIKLLSLVQLDSTAGSSLQVFLTSVVAAIANPAKDSVSSDEEFDLTARGSILAAAAESIAKLALKYNEMAPTAERETLESADRVSVKRIKLFLQILMVLVSSVPDVSGEEQVNLRSAAQGCCIACLRSLLSSSHSQIQLAALQSLSTVAASAGTTTEQQQVGDEQSWALLLLREVGESVMQVIYELTQKPLTTEGEAAVAESLKLLVLWHSMVKGDEAQQNVLHLLLPAMISAATADTVHGNLKGGTPLRTAVVKLVTRLASIPSSAAQFRTVMLELQPESRLQLQAIIKSSMQQQQPSPKAERPTATASPVRLELPKLPTPQLSKPILKAPKSSLPPPPPEPSQIPTTEDDDDWEDFQDNTDDFRGDTEEQEGSTTDQALPSKPTEAGVDAKEDVGNTSGSVPPAPERGDEDSISSSLRQRELEVEVKQPTSPVSPSPSREKDDMENENDSFQSAANTSTIRDGETQEVLASPELDADAEKEDVMGLASASATASESIVHPEVDQDRQHKVVGDDPSVVTSTYPLTGQEDASDTNPPSGTAEPETDEKVRMDKPLSRTDVSEPKSDQRDGSGADKDGTQQD